MSDTVKNNISIGAAATIFVLCITVIFGFFQMLRTADVEASNERDQQLSRRVDNLEEMQATLTELKVDQAKIMSKLGVK